MAPRHTSRDPVADLTGPAPASRSTDSEAAPDVATAGGSTILAGPVAGIVGGLVMAAFLVFAAVAQGMEPLAALEPMGATFRDAEARGGGAGPVLYGVLLHLAVSALVGLLFAMVLPRDLAPGSAGVICVGLAFMVMGIMTSAIVPAVNPTLQARFRELGGSWVIAHALFGFTVGYACQRIRRGLDVRVGRHLRPRTV